MTRLKSVWLPVLSAAVYLLVMALVEQLWQLGYLLKSLVKVTLTVILIGMACAVQKKPPQEVIFFRRMKPAKTLFLVMGVMFAGVFLGFLLLRGGLDLNLIRERLMAKEGLTRQNCLFVFAYIILVNSFLEEAFFRGFLGHALPEPWGIVFGSLAFAVYHIGILDTWVNFGMLVLMTVGLAAVGAALQMICDRFDSLKASWLVHGCANLAINAIGCYVIFSR